MLFPYMEIHDVIIIIYDVLVGGVYYYDALTRLQSVLCMLLSFILISLLPFFLFHLQRCPPFASSSRARRYSCLFASVDEENKVLRV